MTRPFRFLALAALAAGLAACDDDGATGPGAESSTVAVRAYVDANGTGTFDAQDVPISGATVTLESGGETLTETTGADGLATFESVPAGSWRASLSGDVPAGALLAGASNPIVVAPAFGAELATEFRFVFSPGSIRGALFRDENANGVFDPGIDTPAPGIPVALFPGDVSTGEPLAETTTDAEGRFEFGTLRPGTYTLEFTPFPTMELVGGNTQTVTVAPATPASASVVFEGNLLTPIAEAQAAALANEAVVVAVEGVVGFQPSFADELFVQDETAGIQVFARDVAVRDSFDLQPGDTVIVVGTTQLRFGEPQITNVTTLLHRGSGPPPEPTPTAAAEINAGEHLHEVVTIEGATVTEVEVLSFGNQFVTLTDPAGDAFGVYADSRTGVGADTWTVGGIYDVTGILGYDNRFDFDYRIEVRGAEDVVAGEAPSTIAEAKAAPAGTQVTVAGTVIWQPSYSDELWIQDATGGIQIFARDADVRDLALEPGDVVRVTGETEDRFGERQLTRTTAVVKIADQPPPAPIQVTPAEIDIDLVHQLVEVSGATVVDVDSTTLSFGNQLVTLEAPGGAQFGVYVDSRIGVVASDWMVGSVHDIAGVINYDNRYPPFAYRIWLRSPADRQ